MYRLLAVVGVLFFSIAIFVNGCATGRGTDPDDMSYSEHLKAAEKEKAQGKRADATNKSLQARFSDDIFPGASHWVSKKALHENRAEAHAAAAQELLDFQKQACAGIDPPTDQCPLMSNIDAIAAVNVTQGQIELLFPAGFSQSREQIERQARCHFAEGRLLAQADMPGCPLFLKDLTFASLGHKDGSFTLYVRTSNLSSMDSLKEWACNTKKTDAQVDCSQGD